MAPIKSSLARSAAKLFGVFNQTDLSLRGAGNSIDSGSIDSIHHSRSNWRKY